MGLSHHSSSERPAKRSALDQLRHSVRANVLGAILMLAGCSVYKAKPIVIHGSERAAPASLDKEQAVQDTCSLIGRVLAAKNRLPDSLEELGEMCDEKRALEIKIDNARQNILK